MLDKVLVQKSKMQKSRKQFGLNWKCCSMVKSLISFLYTVPKYFGLVHKIKKARG